MDDALTLDILNYNRVVVFGSSDTYGSYLPDCNPDTQSEIKPSQFSWPYVLGDKISIPVNNFAIPGASNREILLSILNSKIVETDLVIVCWTFVNRTYIVNNEQSLIKIYPHTTSIETQHFYRLYDNNNLVHNTFLNISHANLFCLNKKCNVYNFYTDPLINKHPTNIVPLINPLHYLHMVRLINDRATDNRHPGLKSHVNIANFVYDVLNG